MARSSYVIDIIIVVCCYYVDKTFAHDSFFIFFMESESFYMKYIGGTKASNSNPTSR